MEYATGAMAGVMAGFFTNPLDVVKTRLQLQGELKARGQHAVHYKNTLQAFYVIGKTEGIVSLQKGRPENLTKAKMKKLILIIR